MGILSKIKRLFAPSVSETAEERLKSMVLKEIDHTLPNIIEPYLLEKFENEPQKPLSVIGFTWALVLYFEKYWPDIGRNYSVACANDILNAMTSPGDYDLSASAAKELVADYIAEHGEAA